jgi:hypothetical protein
MFDLFSELPLEPLVYELGGLVFAFALLGLAHTTRRLLVLTGRRGLWILPLLGALLMVVVVGLHFYANALYPLVHANDPDLTRAIYQFRFVALLAMLGSSILTLGGMAVLWVWLTGLRGSST